MTYRIKLLLACLLCVRFGALAETFHTSDGQTLSGDIVSADESGFILKDASGNYGQRIPWTKLTQDDLKELLQNPKAGQFVQPFIMVSTEEKLKKTEIEIKDYTHLARPKKMSLIGALFSSPMGLFIILIVMGANLYAAYEIAKFRGHSVPLACGVSFVVPFIAPVVFLSISKRFKTAADPWAAPEEPLPGADESKPAGDASTDAPIAEATAEAAGSHGGQPKVAASELPPARKFARGQFTFNRRFFETQMPGFFAVVRPEALKDSVIGVKSSRGDLVAHRIPRISANDITFQVNKGNASEEVIVPFVELQEVEIRHKDASGE